MVCLLLVLIQITVNNELEKSAFKCGCTCIDLDEDGHCQEVCGIQYSNLLQATTCSIPRPLEWPPLLQLPDPHFRAVRTDFLLSQDLPSDSCKTTDSCRVTLLTTGENQSLGESWGRNLFPSSLKFNPSDGLAGFALGSATSTAISGFLEPALYLQGPVYYVQSQCGANFTNSISVSIAALHVEKGMN
ncbi:ABC transporter A family member 7-like protein [Tanacetum coccineum]|uniref:ABC transporter A family member 7-like protein n=1 Tax=Tanacetum coccineum TaxID=301880 RepID=A0ABQ4XND9_9ASTR